MNVPFDQKLQDFVRNMSLTFFALKKSKKLLLRSNEGEGGMRHGDSFCALFSLRLWVQRTNPVGVAA